LRALQKLFSDRVVPIVSASIRAGQFPDTRDVSFKPVQARIIFLVGKEGQYCELKSPKIALFAELKHHNVD
jgi:hypothetical protein